MPAYTSNFNLYKPDIADEDIEVAPSLKTNFETIDTELKNRKDELEAHQTAVNAHESSKIKHGDGTVQDTLFELGGRIDEAEGGIEHVENRISTIVAQAGTDNTEIVDARGGFTVLHDRLENVDTQLLDLAIDVKTLSAELDGITDDTLAINAAISSAVEGQTVLIAGNARTTDTILINKNINLQITGSIIADHNKAAIIFDGLGRGAFINCHHRLAVRNKTVNHDDETSIGVLVRNCYNQTFDVDLAKDFYYGVKLEADLGKGCVYNEFNLMAISNNKKQIHLSGLNQGSTDAEKSWINQNTFIAGRISWSSVITRAGFTGIQIGNSTAEYLCNGNIFINPSIEDVGVAGVFAIPIDCYGHDNIFISPRTEGGLNYTFQSSSFNNKVLGGFYTTLSNVTDLGNANEFDFARGGLRKWALNNNNGNEFIASGAGTHAAKFYNKTSSDNPVIGVYESDGTTLAAYMKATGEMQWRKNVKHIYGLMNAAPTTGDWQRNDVVWRNNPSAGQYIGWVCVTGGSPGTWKGFGMIEA